MSSTDGVVVCSGRMQELHRMARRVAGTTAPVLIHGETGSGKEVLAEVIHGAGPRSTRPLISLNCGAISPSLLESTLFGHVKGAFTGALHDASGIFAQAHGSTVLLDEVGELPPNAQVALLRVLDTHRVLPIGSSREVAVDVRVVCATHRNVFEMAQAGTFRWDLLYRLSTIVLAVPPLRERREEIAPLARLFATRAAEAWGLGPVDLPCDVLEALTAHDWPGNVRELRNAVERALLACSGGCVRPEDLPFLRPPPRRQHAIALSRSEEAELDFRGRVEAFEVGLIRDALQRARGQRTRAAKLLRMPVRTLSYKIKAYSLGRVRSFDAADNSAEPEAGTEEAS